MEVRGLSTQGRWNVHTLLPFCDGTGHTSRPQQTNQHAWITRLGMQPHPILCFSIVN